MLDHPNAMRNVVASYVRDGHSQGHAVRKAQEWRERMMRAAAEIKAKSS